MNINSILIWLLMQLSTEDFTLANQKITLGDAKSIIIYLNPRDQLTATIQKKIKNHRDQLTVVGA